MTPTAAPPTPPTPPVPRWDLRLLLGILFICASGVLFPVMNGFAKILGADYSTLQVSWARSFGHMVFMLAAFMPTHGLGLLRTRRPGIQLLRSGTLFTSNLSFFFALTYIPIAQAASISMTAPMIVALLAWPMLGERTTVARLVALAVGFAGVLLVIRPGTEVFHWASLFCVLSAASYAVYQILTRRIAALDSPATSSMYSTMLGAFGMIAVLPFVWKTPHGWFEIALFCGMGVLGALGHYCVARALQYAPANVVTPFQYFQLFGSVAVGWLIFDDLPDVLTWVGAGVIIASGIYIGWSQARMPRPAARP